MNGDQLIKWGFKPGAWFKAALDAANDLERQGATSEDIYQHVRAMVPVELEKRTNTLPFTVFSTPESDASRKNMSAVVEHMDNLMRVPTVTAGAVMPDACPAGGAAGTIPVGGVLACENAIHPGFHSADICCSVAISVFGRNVDPKRVLDTAEKISHFGPGGRTDNDASSSRDLARLLEWFDANSFLAGLQSRALHHFKTQGDGNHFFFVGMLDGRTVIVTHHGSRGLGADLYKRGKAVAERETRKIAPRIPSHQAWIPADTPDGREYWDALQHVREWTKLNHFAIHDGVARTLGVRVQDRWWNEHNFVFRKTDGLFYHAKGATPNYRGFAHDDGGLTLIPLNMGAGVLVSDHSGFTGPKDALGFCPHGAGRNMSRSEHMRGIMDRFGDSRGLSPRAIEQVLTEETGSIDARFWSGRADLSELPSAYKNPDQIIREIQQHKLANITHQIVPQGSIMAGNDQRDWKKLKAEKKSKTLETEN